MLNMFRKLIYPSLGACDYSVELPHWSYCSWFEACNTDTTPTQPHRNSNTHRTKNNTTNVVIQQNSRKLLMVNILMSKTCWAHKKWNKVASDIKLVFYSSTITMTHGPINIRYKRGCVGRKSVYLYERPKVKVWQRCPDTVIYTSVLFFSRLFMYNLMLSEETV